MSGRMKLGKTPKARQKPEAPRGLDPDDPGLREDLELACLDALRGDPPGPAVERRLELACRSVLASYGASGARIEASSTRGGTGVRIRLPRPDDTVQELVLTVG